MLDVQKNKMKKLLITGISGFLGNCFAKLHLEDWQLTGWYHQRKVTYPGIETQAVNLADSAAVEAAFHKVQADALIHLAAIAQPNACEKHPAFARTINVDATVLLASLCEKRGIPFLFTSTDLVFDGKHAPYDEQAKTLPVNLYGRHKVAAEQAIQEVCPTACIARCPLMFGIPDAGNSFLKGWLTALQAGREIFAFEDEYRTAVSGETAVKGLMLLLNQGVSGTWHLGGKERLSRYDFAIKMANVFKLPTALIKASKQADVQMLANRPADVSLDSAKAFDLGYDPLSTELALRRMS